MLSIIIPTMQKDLDVLNKLLFELQESDVVGEVVVIDNSCKGFDTKFNKVKVFTQKEIEYCESKGKQKYQHYAARFAAKEAIFKAISIKLKNKYEIGWKDIEILDDTSGRPYVNILNECSKLIKNIDISLSHCKEYPVATAIVCY